MFPHYSLHTFHPPLPPSSVVSISLFSTGSRLIHLISADSNASLLWLSNIPLYTRTTASLSIHLSMEIYIHQSSFCLFKLVDWVSFFSLTIKQSKNMTFHYSDSSDFFFFFSNFYSLPKANQSENSGLPTEGKPKKMLLRRISWYLCRYKPVLGCDRLYVSLFIC